jgi:hypothetical protein
MSSISPLSERFPTTTSIQDEIPSDPELSSEEGEEPDPVYSRNPLSRKVMYYPKEPENTGSDRESALDKSRTVWHQNSALISELMLRKKKIESEIAVTERTLLAFQKSVDCHVQMLSPQEKTYKKVRKNITNTKQKKQLFKLHAKYLQQWDTLASLESTIATVKTCHENSLNSYSEELDKSQKLTDSELKESCSEILLLADSSEKDLNTSQIHSSESEEDFQIVTLSAELQNSKENKKNTTPSKDTCLIS